MLETLISSKTRLNLLVRFFLNLAKESHLRGLASDFKESTNSIRVELNNLTKAGYLIKRKEKNKINYLANTKHPLYSVMVDIVKKHTGIEQIINNLVLSFENLNGIYLVGDYAKGIDSGKIKLYIDGDIVNLSYLNKIIKKVEVKIKRRITIVPEIKPFDDILNIYLKDTSK
tara:strand:+ start:97 stop:612 length:516 start_codon:yes stop_codon:yes gene_type:complete